MRIFDKLFSRPDIKKLRQERDVNSLIKALAHKDWIIRSKAADALGDLKDPSAVEDLLLALKDKEPAVRWAAMAALGDLGDSRAVRPLRAALKAHDQIERLAAVKALKKLLPPEKAKKLTSKAEVDNYIAQLQNRNSSVRKEAANALGELAHPRAVKALIELMQNESLRILRATMRGYGSRMTVGSRAEQQHRAIEAEEDIDRLIQMNVRGSAAEALAKIGEPAIPSLLEALEDKDNRFLRVRVEAARVLGELRALSAVPSLIAALEDQEADVVGLRETAAEALKRIGGPEAEQALSEYQRRLE